VLIVADRKDISEDFAKFVWGKRAENLPVPGFDLTREITPEEISYINMKFAYVQIMNPHAMNEFSEGQQLRAKSGYAIIDYENAMSASPGELLFTDQVFVREGENYKQINTGSGTRIKQIIDTAAEMVQLAQQKGWPAIHILSGHPKMCWGIWKAAQDLQIPVTGYAPSKEEEAKYHRIENNCPSLIIQAPTIKI
jgi:hypothetical protein